MPVDSIEADTELDLMDSQELLGFLHLSDISVNHFTEGPAAAVRVSSKNKHDETSLLSLELLRTSRQPVSTVQLAVPSAATAGNLVRLLQEGVLGLALLRAGDFRSTSAPQTVMYTWEPGSLPSLQPHGFCKPPGSAGKGWNNHLTSCGYPEDAAAPSCRAGDCSAQGSFLAHVYGGLRSAAEAIDYHQATTDWQAAVYLNSSQASYPQGCCCAADSCPARRTWPLNLGPPGGGMPSISSTAAAGYLRASAGPPSTTGEASTSAGQPISLRLGVCAAALERLATSDPEDVQQRAWQGKLLDVLRWLLPHIATDTIPEQPATPALPLQQQQRQQQPVCPEGAGPATPSAQLLPPDDDRGGGASLGWPALASPKSFGATVAGTSTAAPGPAQPMSPGAAAAAAAASAVQGFDVGWLYDAVKPSGNEPQWVGDPAELRPRLRPYQRRAVAWMLRREQAGRGPDRAAAAAGQAQEAAVAEPRAVPAALRLHPLWRRLVTLPGSAAGAVFVNAYTGALASEPFAAPGPVRGGILSDEMGLGKTVELLALITANRFEAPQPQPQQAPPGSPPAAPGDQRPPERVDCPCGVRADDPDDPAVEDYSGLWIMCEACNAWMHGVCVGVKRNPRKAWACTRCLRARALATVSEPCGATLIVVPSAILQQWYDEIRRHVRPGTLRVVVYGGQTQPGAGGSGLICGSFGGGSGGAAQRGRGQGAARAGAGGEDDVAESLVVSAAQLAAADVVLTTYDVLKRDVTRQPDRETQERSLRHGKRYEVVPTPLTRLRWWRVVLDEAQMVESSTARATEMALKLDTVHRWCVTGTPISRGLEDVYGLMAFLGARPWIERRWWNRCVQRPVEAGDPAGRRLLLRLLRPTAGVGGDSPAGGGLMWRSAKRDVEGELGLPAQSTHISQLRLNAVELHFYNRQHQDCAAKAREVLPPQVVAAMESGRLLGGSEVAEAEREEQMEQQQQLDAEEEQPEGRGAAASAVVASADDHPSTGSSAAAEAGQGAGGSEQQGRQGKQQAQGHGAEPQRPDALRELRDLQRRRWELSWQGAEGGRSPQGQTGGGGGASASAAAGGPSTSAAAAAAADPILVDLTGAAAAAEDRMDGELHGGGDDDRDGGAGPSGRGDGGGGRPGSHRGASPSRRRDPRKARKAQAASLDRPLAPNEARKLLVPLLKLRQACCHPQVGAGRIRSLKATGQLHLHGGGPGGTPHTAPMTMAEILAVLVTRARVEAEDAQRQLIAALNGLSGLMIIQGDLAEAIATYRTALRVMEDNKPDIDTDPLQRLHTLHNLAQMLVAAAAPTAPAALAAVPRTLRDHTLDKDAAAIRSRLLEQRRQKLAVEEASYRELVAAASPFHGAAGWYLAAIDLLQAEGHGPAATDHIKEKLLEGDTYRQKTEVNASSMAHRFSTLLGLKMVLNDSLDAIEQHRREAMRSLEALGVRTRKAQPDPDFVEQAGQCGRCRGVQGASRALVCEHCRLDERFIQWEVRLFALYSRALTAGATVTAEEAARRAQAAMVRWAGRGGLHEGEQGATEEAEEGDDEFGGRRGANVAVANTSWRQSEAEMVLRLLLVLLRQHLRLSAKEPRVAEIMHEGKAHVSRLEAQRRLLLAARSACLAQRNLLYMHDELDMATLRMRLVREGEPIAEHEFNLKLHPAAVPAKNVQLTSERIVAEGDLRTKLGTLRYLRKLQTIQDQQQERKQLQQQQQQQQQQEQQHQGQAPAENNAAGPSAAATAGPSGSQPPSHAPDLEPPASGLAPCTAAPTSQLPTAAATVPNAGAGTGAAAGNASSGASNGGEVAVEEEICPICHDALDCSAADSVILPCGHQMHPPCCEALVAKTVAPGTPHHQKKITCPTCRTRVHIVDIAYIGADLTRGSDGAAGSNSGGDGGPWSGEAGVVVRGSFGTKLEAVVRRVKFVLGQDAAAKVLVFSGWADLLELVAAALAANAVPYVAARAGGGMAAALAAFKDHPGELDSLEDLDLGLDEDGPAAATAAATVTAERGGGNGGGPAVVEEGQELAAGGELGDHEQREGGPEAAEEEAGRGPGTPPHSGGGGSAAPRRTARPASAKAARSGGGRRQPHRHSHGSPRAALGSPAKQGQAKPRVLLLQLKQGGAGLNLTEAQHVVLVEPQLDPAMEAQAVGRVHRIGQTRPTHVHRFVVTHTVEEQVFKLASARARGMGGMDGRSAVVPGGGGGAGGGHHGRGGGGDGSEQLTLRDVAILLDTRRGTVGPETAAPGAAAAAAAEAGGGAPAASARGQGQGRGGGQGAGSSAAAGAAGTSGGEVPS